MRIPLPWQAPSRLYHRRVELLERGPALAALHRRSTRRSAARAGLPPSPARRASGRRALSRRSSRRPPARCGCSPAPATTCSPPAPSARCTTSRTGSAPAVGALLDGPAPAGRYRAVVEALRSEPTVLVVEDVHWADEATLDWLAHLGRRLAELPVLLVLTFRDDDPEPTTRIARVLATCRGGGDTAVAGRAVRGRGGGPRRAARRRGLRAHRRQPVAGHRAARGRRSGGAAVRRRRRCWGRLAAAPPHARPAIERGRSCRVSASGGWSRARAGGLDAVEAAMRTGLLVAERPGVRFRHELTRRVVVEALFVPRRHALHRRSSRVLEARADVDPARLAHHARSAGRAAGDPAPRRGRGGSAARGPPGLPPGGRPPVPRRCASTTRPVPTRVRAARAASPWSTTSPARWCRPSAGGRPRPRPSARQLDQPHQVGDNLRWLARLYWYSGAAGGRRGRARRGAGACWTRSDRAPSWPWR